jgi:hypothetical protein
VVLYLHFPNTPLWLGAQLKKHRDNFTFLSLYLGIYVFNNDILHKLIALNEMDTKFSFSAGA